MEERYATPDDCGGDRQGRPACATALLTLALIPLGTPAHAQPAPVQPCTRVVHFEFPAADAQPVAGMPVGTIETRKLNSRALGEERLINVYTPPGYSKKQTYPLLILLHGSGMTEAQWLTGSVQHYLDRYIAAQIPRSMVVVMPGAPDEFFTGRSEDHVVNEVYPFIARRYSIREGPDATAIGGMSMDGFGAFYLRLRATHRQARGQAVP